MTMYYFGTFRFLILLFLLSRPHRCLSTQAIDVEFTSQPKNAYGRVGQTLTLSCEASGVSAKYIKWYNDQTEIPQSAVHSTSTSKGLISTLKLSKVQLNQGSTEYHCKVGPSLNHSNSVNSQKATVGILGSFSWSFKNRFFHPGQTARALVCSVSANPRPTSAKVTLDGKTLASLDETAKNSSYLWPVWFKRLSSITAEDGGHYTCIGEMSSSVRISRTVLLGVTAILSEKPKPITLASGERKTLVCKAKGYPVPSITWKGTIRQKTETFNGVESFVLSRRERTSTLTFSGDSLNQAGSYQCIATNVMFNGYTTNKTFSVNVSVAPKIIKLSPLPQNILEGSSATPVECIAEGYPKPIVIWKLNELSTRLKTHEISSIGSASAYTTGSSLTLGTVAFSQDANVYTCQAKNSAGTISSKFTLTVTINATFTVEPRDTYVKVGDNLNLTCEATGGSAKYLHWYKGNQKLSCSSLSSSTSTSQKLSSTLTLCTVELMDGSTQYHCRVGPTADLSKYVSSRHVTVGILGSINGTFRNRHFNSGQSSSSPLICSFSANPRPTGGGVKLNGKVIAFLGKMVKSSLPYWWTLWTKPIKSITVQDGGRYTCFGRMGPTAKISHTIQIGITPTIYVRPQPLILAPDRTKNVSCKATGFPVPLIMWIRKIGDKIRRVTNNEIIHTHNQERERESSLIFIGGSVDQAGSYQCVATNVMTDGIHRTAVSSFVDVAAKPLIITHSSSRKANRRSSQTLECVVTGYPLPAIIWNFRRKHLTGAQLSSADGVTRSSTLKREAINALKDGGEYTCNAANSVGRAHSIKLTLKFDPLVTTNPISRSIAYGKKLVLSCQVASYPAISAPIQWRKDGTLLPSSWSTDTHIKYSYNAAVISIIRIFKVTEATGGNYTCYESPKPGTIKVHNHFIVNPQSATSIEGSSTRVSCKVVGYPVGDIIWEASSDKTNFVLIPIGKNFHVAASNGERFRESALTIVEIQRKDSGFYRCKTSGILKNSLSEIAYIVAAYLDSVTLRFFGKATVGLGDTFGLSCTAVGNPSPHVIFYMTNLVGIPETKEIKADNNHKFTRESNRMVTLTVSNSRVSDSGYYFCRAINLAGFVHSDATVITVTPAE